VEDLEATVIKCVVATLILVLLLGGCFMGDGRGFKVWATNQWDTPVHIVLEGDPSPDGLATRSSFRADPGIVDTSGSFVDLTEGNDGWVEVFDVGCMSLGRFEVDAGDFGVTISADGEATIREYGFAQRPTTQERLPPSADCLH
jgi:hypothetical protein